MTFFLWVAQVAATLLLTRLVWVGLRSLLPDAPERTSSPEQPSRSSAIIRPRPRS